MVEQKLFLSLSLKLGCLPLISLQFNDSAESNIFSLFRWASGSGTTKVNVFFVAHVGMSCMVSELVLVTNGDDVEPEYGFKFKITLTSW